MRKVITILCLFGLACTGSSICVAQESDPPTIETPDRTLAITIDDLPLGHASGFASEEHRRAVVERFCQVITDAGVPVTGFVNMGQDEDHPELMPIWRDCGIQLGNHTWSHPRLGDVDVDTYLEDLRRGHEALAAFAPEQTTITFRYPYLRRGFDATEHEAIQQLLQELHSPIAPITINNLDFLYSRDYTQALQNGEEQQAEQLVQEWRWNLEEATQAAESLSVELFGREPPQILLLHANEMNADHLGEFLQWLTDRGYSFVPLEEALADPAYSEPDWVLTRVGDSQWVRVRRTRTLVEQ